MLDGCFEDVEYGRERARSAKGGDLKGRRDPDGGERDVVNRRAWIRVASGGRGRWAVALGAGKQIRR